MAGGGGETAAGRGLKKGPWTAAEDAILTEYVKKHGEGNWNAVMKNSGLLRCGKSCRLRWANHLRPNLKKGCFSPDEENIILQLHATLGNKWARMASQLPGRTDNEIKNYWNTRMKRRQRAGLPLYPQEIQEELASFQFQNQSHQTMMHTSSNSPSSSSSFSSSSSQPRKRPCLDPLSNLSLNPIPDPCMSYQMFTTLYTNYHDNDSNTRFGFSLPLSSSSSSNDLYNPNHLLEFISENSDTNNNNSIDVMSYSSLLMGEEIGPSSFPLGLDTLELPSNQTPRHSFTSNTLHDNENDPMPPSNSGLLDALLEESQALSRVGVSKEITISLGSYKKEKRVDQEEEGENRLDILSSSDHSSTGTNPNNNKYKEPTSEKSMMDDDDDLLMSLLNNFPSSTPLPDWYRETGNQSNGSDLTSPGGTLIGNLKNKGLDPSQASSSDLDPMLSSCCWSNMPGIC